MTKGLDLGGLGDIRLIGILRGCPPEHLLKSAQAAVSAGINAVEVTFDSVEPALGIKLLREELPGVAIGAGTVLSEDQLESAFDAGAEFMVSPVTDQRIIEAARQCGLFCIPGAATPTEIAEASTLGADAVKIFPADMLGGPSYLRSIMGPVGSVHLVPTGGITDENVAAYFEAGAAALGVGAGLFPPDALAAGDVGKVMARAEALVKAAA